MSDFEISHEWFKSAFGDFLVSIQTIRVVDAAAFQRVDREATELAQGLKGQALVPRSLLNELRVATKVLRSEAPYVDGGRNDLESMANKLEMTFDLIP